MEAKEYDVIIIGAGISGTALLYTLSHYSNVKKIAVIEKYEKPALVNSNLNNNSQTLHMGDIETNYTLEKATKVKRAAYMVKHYLDKHDKEKKIHSIYDKMVIAVGDEEVMELEKRHKEFRKLFPKMRKIDRNEIAKLEPKIVEGRGPEKLMALASKDGYTVDYHRLAESFLEKSTSKNKDVDLFFNRKVSNIESKDGRYEVGIGNERIVAKVLAVTAGSHSLLFAKSLGCGLDYALLSVAGSFYFAPQALKGKVYTWQIKKLPFAAVHGDPEVHDRNSTRFGPTAKVLPMLERGNYKTVYEYFKTAGLTVSAFQSFFSILSDWIVFKYIVRNLMYDIPWIGKRMFIKEAKKVVPTMTPKDITKAKGYGGVRPQIVNKKTKALEMGEAKIFGHNAIFNITPSPGASTCLRNAYDDVEKIVGFLGRDYNFDKRRFEKDFIKS